VKSLREARPTTIAVHCVAGLGRAPVLVAIALIELGMAPLDAIEYIREKRRGAFNKPQIMFLDSYKRKPTANKNSFRNSLSRMLGFGPKTVPHPT
jgi:protein tyrosine phosphatase type 4A